MNMSTEDAFRRSVETVVDWITRELNRNKTYVLFRTYAPVHFRFAQVFKQIDLYFIWSKFVCNQFVNGKFNHNKYFLCGCIRGGDWNTGGGCHMETLPDLGSLPVLSDVHFSTVTDVLSEHVRKSNVLNVDLLNVTQMSVRRKDGHMSIYYLGQDHTAAMQRQDCSHWCLPGVPDSWNEILYALLLKKEGFSKQNTTNVSQILI